MFPTIITLDDLLPHIEGNTQIRVKTETNGMIVVCYMVQDEETFTGDKEEYARECRGITFHPDKTIAARCLTKFFNVGERDETLPENIDWTQVVRVMEKRDGSMVTPVLVNGAIRCKTKKSFETKEAALADELIYQSNDRYNWVKKLLLDGFTPTFEVTSPKYPIVVRYEKDELTLLHVRENITGHYLSDRELQSLSCPFPIAPNIINEFKSGGLRWPDGGFSFVDWKRFEHAAQTIEGIEGWVVQLASGEMFKIKTKWYCDLHHSVTFTRWRDVARTVCADQSDDLKAAFRMVGRDIEPILIVERKIKAKIQAIEDEINGVVAMGKDGGLDAKQMALKWKDHNLFGLIMRAFRGQEIKYMEYYEKHYLENDWGLEVIA